MRTRNEELFAKKRNEILHAAESCFVENGFHQTSMQEICSASNMSPGGLYRYFRSKAEIIQAIAESRKDQLDKLVLQADKKKNPEKAIVAVLEAAIDNMNDLGRPELDAEIMSEALRNQAIAKSLEASQQQLRDFFDHIIRKGKKNKRISKDVKAGSVVSFLLAFIRSLSMQRAMDPNFNPAKLKPHLRGFVRSLLTPGPN